MGPFGAGDIRYSLGEPQLVSNLMLFPIKASSADPKPRFRTLEEGLADDSVQITEPGGGHSRVGIQNRSGSEVFIIDGEGITGGKQNRIAAASLVIGPRVSKEIPAYCSEHGRWAGSKSFSGSNEIAYPSIRRLNTASRSSRRTPQSIQSSIWMEISRKQASLKVHSATQSMQDIYASTRSGESVLIHAIGSGVGTAALQLARAMGATTFGTSRTREKVAGALELGLDAGVVADAAGHWVEEVKRRSRGYGVDVILDLVGATYIEWNLDVLGNRGRWVVVGVPGGAKGEIDLRRLMAKRATVHGTVLRARPDEEKTALAREFERPVVPLFERGLLKPVIDRTYSPSQAADAHRRMEANESFGKLMLVWE